MRALRLGTQVCDHMSSVGPGSEVPEYVDAEGEFWQLVLRVRPEIMDLVTVRLRNEGAVLAAAGGEPERFYRESL